jgi:hypothetical protein
MYDVTVHFPLLKLRKWQPSARTDPGRGERLLPAAVRPSLTDQGNNCNPNSFRKALWRFLAEPISFSIFSSLA